MSLTEDIRKLGLTIYDQLLGRHEDLFFNSQDLQEVLSLALDGLSLNGLALRTRSKVVKEHICDALGYPREALGNKPASQGSGFQMLGIDHRSADQA